MSETHTPGPWLLGHDGDYSEFRIGIWHAGVPGDDLLAEVCHLDGYRPGESGEANARLIAAAPDLLSACQAMLEAAAWGGMGGREGRTSDAIRLIEAAVAKATKKGT